MVKSFCFDNTIEFACLGNYHGLAGHRTPDNAKDFAGKSAVVAFYGVDYVKNVKGTNYWRNRVAKVSFYYFLAMLCFYGVMRYLQS